MQTDDPMQDPEYVKMLETLRTLGPEPRDDASFRDAYNWHAAHPGYSQFYDRKRSLSDDLFWLAVLVDPEEAHVVDANAVLDIVRTTGWTIDTWDDLLELDDSGPVVNAAFQIVRWTSANC